MCYILVIVGFWAMVNWNMNCEAVLGTSLDIFQKGGA